MKSFFRLNEYSVLFYRIALAYLFYFIARILFFTYNNDILDVNSVTEFLQISYHGLVFDTTAILYVNGLFILLSILPFFINTKPKYQKGLFYLYFIYILFIPYLHFIYNLFIHYLYIIYILLIFHLYFIYILFIFYLYFIYISLIFDLYFIEISFIFYLYLI